MIVTAYPSSDGTRVEFTRASHELTTSDLCSIDFDLRLSRCRSKNNRRKDKSCNNGRAAHDPCSLSRPCEDKPTKSGAKDRYAQAVRCHRRHQPRRPTPARIRPGSPAPAMGAGTFLGVRAHPLATAVAYGLF